MQRRPSRAGRVQDSRALQGSGGCLARAGWLQKPPLPQSMAWGSWDSPVGGCKTRQVQKAPSVGAGETGGFVVAARRSRFTCAHLVGKNRTCAGLCLLGNGTVSLQAIRVAIRSGVPVSLPSIVFKRNFFKAPPFPFTDYLGIRVFQLPVVSPSLRLNCKKSRCAAKEVSAFYNL